MPFTVTIPADAQDKRLPQKLRAERVGILTWLVRGCLDWPRHGLGEPETVQAATTSYRTEQDVIGTFLDERCIIGRAERERAGLLFKAYQRWCEQAGERPLSQTRFGRILSERGFDKQKASILWYLDLALRGEFTTPE